MYRTRVHRSSGRPTRDDVARHANISGATVSRVLSGRTDVAISPETRARVLEAAERLGYQPNSAARALNNGRTGLVGFWMSLQYSRYRGQVLDQMRTLLGGTEMALAVTDVDEEYQWDHNFSRALRVPVDGIVAFDNSASVAAFAAQRARLAPTTPFVSMGAYWSEAKSYVGVDLRAGAQMAVDHLLETGRRRIAYLTTQDSDPIVEAGREEGYRERMIAAGLTPQTIAVSAIPSERAAAIASALEEARRKNDLPDALICMFDDLAVDALDALNALKLRPGIDIALIGFNGTEGLERGPCPLSTIRQPIETMCALAFEFLQAQIVDPTGPLQQRILMPELVVRASTRGS